MKDRRRRASQGVIVLSIVLIAYGAINFVSVIASICLLNLETKLPLFMPFLAKDTFNSTVFWFSTTLSILIGLAWIVAGAGMLSLKEWARQLLFSSVGVYFFNFLINVALNLYMLFEYSMKVPLAQLIGGILFVLTFSVGVTYFFGHPNVVKQFTDSRRFVQKKQFLRP